MSSYFWSTAGRAQFIKALLPFSGVVTSVVVMVNFVLSLQGHALGFGAAHGCGYHSCRCDSCYRGMRGCLIDVCFRL